MIVTRLTGSIVLMIGLGAGVASTAQAQTLPTDEALKTRTDELREMRKEMRRAMLDFDARIKKLEAEIKRSQSVAAKAVAAKPQAPAAPLLSSSAEEVAFAAGEPADAPRASQPSTRDGVKLFGFGDYVPGKGYILASGDKGQVAFGLVTYLRFLDQTSLAPTYTDAFGRSSSLQLREDAFLNKVVMTFNGWLFDPNFNYRMYAWTQNPAQGLGAQVVLAGEFGYRFDDYVHLGGGVSALPTTRSTNSSYMYWLRVDNRTVADEFFRGSYTFGMWADGKLGDDIGYKAMVGNNLSALGVNAGRLSAGLNTESAAVWWMPTTGEFGPTLGFGDYEDHQSFATLFGVHYTHSRENRQEQPGVNDFDNAQIRLSDGTLLFSPDPFKTGGFINDATYQMADANAGFKYRGWSLEGEYYARWIGNFQATGFIPVTNLFDQGFQLQASTMLWRKKLQAYVSGSAIYGQYGDPWDIAVGLNWYPFGLRELRLNSEAIYTYRSPVGALSLPYIVGGTGWLYNTDFVIAF